MLRGMAQTVVALIRGINVGKAKRVAMADLRARLEKAGFRDVRTLLNSGNVVFTSPRGSPADAGLQVEKALVALGVPARVTMLSAGELNEIVTKNPLGKVAKDPTRLFASVLTDPADKKKLAPLVKQDWSPEVLAVGARVAYQWCPKGLLEGKLPEAVGRALGDGVTTRNWATITKLHALVGVRG